ncbi:MAG: NADH:flavin oxidoreductase [Bacillota bacterium]
MKVFSPWQLAQLSLPNRIVRSSTYEAMATPDGLPTSELEGLYSRLARGGTGLIITGITSVDATGCCQPVQTGLYHEGAVPAWRRVTDTVHRHGAAIAVQLAHAGRQTAAGCGHPPVSPSRFFSTASGRWARALRPDEIEYIVEAFARSAARAQAAGFDAVQINAAHGYLISGFLTPLTNRRSDRWGKDRCAFLEEVYRAVRGKVGPGYPVLAKLNLMDFVPGGLSLQAGMEAAHRLAALGIDAIEVSGGIHETIFFSSRGDIPVGPLVSRLPAWQRPAAALGLWAMKPLCRFREGFFLPLAARLRPALKCPLIVVGGLRSPGVIRDTVESGAADAVALSRPLISEPSFPRQLAAGRQEPARCRYCNRCIAGVAGQLPLRCYRPAKENI